MALLWKSILSDMSIATLAFFSLRLLGKFVSSLSLSVCVGLLFRGGSLVGRYVWVVLSYLLGYSMSFDWNI